ncbi:MAG TPA: glucose 1-dehydrogenase [Burkholderiales bacterium]|nr:glucose 1-dehydrogenase [Burkholderiales bacterium]
MRLKNKVAIITGGANGMGAAEAMLFAREGAKVVIVDVRDAEGEAVAKTIQSAGGEGSYQRLDVSLDADWQKVLAATLDRHGRLDVLVNNAGVSGVADPDMLSLPAWERLMEVNAKGVFLGMKHAIPAMRRSGGGAIVNISSIAAFGAMEGLHMGYNASKAACHLMTKTAAVQYAHDGIRANSVHPGMLPPMLGSRAKVKADPAMHDKVLERVPMRRVGRVEEVAHAVLFLASDEASYITGTSLIVDGGWLARQ